MTEHGAATMPAPSSSIVVMPFDNLSADPETGYFARGFVEDLIADLTRFRSCGSWPAPAASGLPRSSGQPTTSLGSGGPTTCSPGASAAETARYASRRSCCAGPTTAWSGPSGSTPPMDAVFDIQDEITALVAGTLAVQVGDAQLSRTRGRSLDELPAYDCWLRGLDLLRRGTLEDDAESRTFFQRALEIDPDYARAWSGLSISHFNEWTCQSWHLFDESGEGAFQFAAKAGRARRRRRDGPGGLVSDPPLPA